MLDVERNGEHTSTHCAKDPSEKSRPLPFTGHIQKEPRWAVQRKWTFIIALSLLLGLAHRYYHGETQKIEHAYEPVYQPDTTKWDRDQVTFDNYSLILRGQRIFLKCVLVLRHLPRLLPKSSSGEFHTFRLPVPDLWPDILQKFKAAGMNSVSLYTHMGIINPSRGVLDFDDWRALRPFYEAATAAGIWVVLRPGM